MFKIGPPVKAASNVAINQNYMLKVNEKEPEKAVLAITPKRNLWNHLLVEGEW